MGYLEDAISKTKEVFDVACQRTGEFVVTEKQKFNVASLKSKREKDFAKLGKIYYELILEGMETDEETQILVEEIIQKNEEIDRINEEIQNIKNKRICPNCSANIDAKSSYCNICGIKID